MMTPRSFLFSRQPQTSSPSTRTQPSSSPPSSSQRLKYDRKPLPNATATTTANMGNAKRKQTESLSPPSPPKTTTVLTRPTTPTSPVQIPVKSKRDMSHTQSRLRHCGDRKQLSHHRPRDVHSPDSIPPSVAALLAVTSIPPPKRRSLRGTQQQKAKRMTVGQVIEHSQESEKVLSLSLGKSPMDMLLSPPEDLEGDDFSVSDGTVGTPRSVFSTRTVSLDSMPSLSNSFGTETVSSVGTPSTSSRSRKSRPTRSSLEPISSPLGATPEQHPLSGSDMDVDEMDFRVFQASDEPTDAKSETTLRFQPLRSAFKSNLTASLRALRLAARSISAINLPLVSPEDFLTRSILTIDPQVPFTDERRPPVMEEEPTAELRRYLNPSSSLDVRPSSPRRSFTASIQMQTYKVYRSRSAPPLRTRVAAAPSQPAGELRKAAQAPFSLPNGMRQREMRENSDFIRVAVMEMAMRKRGKLDDQRPGRARWALPPRRLSQRPYEVGSDGVPARWVAVTY